MCIAPWFAFFADLFLATLLINTLYHCHEVVPWGLLNNGEEWRILVEDITHAIFLTRTPTSVLGRTSYSSTDPIGSVLYDELVSTLFVSGQFVR